MKFAANVLDVDTVQSLANWPSHTTGYLEQRDLTYLHIISIYNTHHIRSQLSGLASYCTGYLQ